jgi:hypothetical protein
MRLWLDDARVDVDTAAPFGQGGEAEVHDLADGRVLKLFKAAAHPDFAGDAGAQAAAAARLAEHQAKLPAFPAGLPPGVVAPGALARRTRGGELVGYAMRKVAGDALYHVGEPGWRRTHGVELARVSAALGELGRTVARVHAAGVVIGDFNDLNVLVDLPAARAWLIDADSFQYGAWPCRVFTERFVDPRLCDPRAPGLVLAAPHDERSDWYAFAAMALRSLLAVGPWGGVHAPADPARRVPPGQRARRGVSIYDADVRAPRAALPIAVLPDELNAAFHDVFARGARGPFPLARLDALRWQRCACGAEHARASCPVCRTVVAVPAAIVRGGVRATRVDAAELRATSWAVGRTPNPAGVWLDGGMLHRTSAHGPELVGQVLAGHTRAWTSATFGVGFYRAGGLTVGFVFRPDRRGLNDRVALPPLRGHLVDAHAIVGDRHAWLSCRLAAGGVETIVSIVVDASGTVCATRTDDAEQASLHRGAVAIGSHLFAPTDDGVIRLDGLAITRRFPDTAELVSAADELFLGPRGLDVRRPDGTTFRMEMP